MGELGISITDLAPCPNCKHQIPMIFQDEKRGWNVVCSYHGCGHKTKYHLDLLDAADQWGLK